MMADGQDDAALLSEYLRDPFARLPDAEAARLSAIALPQPLGALIAARHAATRLQAPRYVVFCMPKSGSSFVQSALQHALELPLVSLTSFGSGLQSTRYGMNPREQELDELAVIKSVLASPGGFVAQHHTRYTQYLALQAAAFGLTPILTLRNILDALVSFDDMLLDWRRGKPPQDVWTADPLALPRDYPELPAADRYSLLARSHGVWLVQFFLSWKRGARQGLISPLTLGYEKHVLDPPQLTQALAEGLGLTTAQTARLAAYAARPDPARSRLNVGRAGRGRDLVPDDCRAFLLDYARVFRDEISEGELTYLFG